MKYYLTSYILDSIPNHRTIHALATRIFGKESENKFRVELNNKKISFFHNEEVQSEDSYKIENDDFPVLAKVLKRNFSVESNVSEGETLSISGLVSYGAHQKNAAGKSFRTCPVWQNYVEHKGLFSSFLASMGVELATEKVFVNREEAILIKRAKTPIMIHNVFFFEVTVKVNNPELFNEKLAFGCGQKKSYGLGNLKAEAA